LVTGIEILLDNSGEIRIHSSARDLHCLFFPATDKFFVTLRCAGRDSSLSQLLFF
jgi:hypothetical protein